jgi:hypothetical protein
VTKAQSRSTVLHRNAKAVRRLREISLTFEAIGAEFELTRQRIQEIAQGAGITWKTPTRVF